MVWPFKKKDNDDDFGDDLFPPDSPEAQPSQPYPKDDFMSDVNSPSNYQSPTPPQQPVQQSSQQPESFQQAARTPPSTTPSYLSRPTIQSTERAEPSRSEEGKHDLILAKLDNLKSMLETVSQRLTNIETRMQHSEDKRKW